MSLAALWRVKSSQARDWTCVPCVGRQILNQCTTREVPVLGSSYISCHSHFTLKQTDVRTHPVFKGFASIQTHGKIEWRCQTVTTERTPVIFEESGRKGNKPGEERWATSQLSRKERAYKLQTRESGVNSIKITGKFLSESTLSTAHLWATDTPYRAGWLWSQGQIQAASYFCLNSWENIVTPIHLHII